MRRLALVSAALALLAVPAAASGAASAPGDGSLVVQNGAAPWTWRVPGDTDVPVVQLTITGSVIGRVNGLGRIVIDSGSDTDAVVQVVGAGNPTTSKKISTAQVWVANDFRFRAVNGTFTILIYGSDVSLVAVGKGSVRLAGLPDAPHEDGRYSLNDGDFRSLPSAQTAKLPIAANG